MLTTTLLSYSFEASFPPKAENLSYPFRRLKFSTKLVYIFKARAQLYQTCLEQPQVVSLPLQRCNLVKMSLSYKLEDAK